MEVRDRKSLVALVKGFKVFDEGVIEYLIHFVRVFEIYPYGVWMDYLNRRSASKWILILAARHPHWYIRCLVSENPKTPVNILEVLGGDKHGYVRRIVVRNPNTPKCILEAVVDNEGESQDIKDFALTILRRLNGGI